MKILINADATEKRKHFIDSFVDCQCQHYVQYIQQTKIFSDGECYTGYLWDCIPNIEETPYDKAILSLLLQTGCFYALWDIHSKDRIFIPDYWKFPKESVLELEAQCLEEYLPLLPEDVYFFDDTYTWCVIITHEYDKGRRLCYFVNNNN